MKLYPWVFKNVISRLEPELSHKLAAIVLKFLPGKVITSPSLKTTAMGLDFPNRLGIAAGFDKNASYITRLSRQGFGFIEVGTVTAVPQGGNPKPRLFRLPLDRALINRMGFNNEGADKVAIRLQKTRKKNPNLIVGVNLGKSKVVELSEASSDYLSSLQTFAGLADYFVINVSSPNTPGLRDLQAPEQLRPLLTLLIEHSTAPILLKIAPDLSNDQLLDLAKLVEELGLAGIIATNTTLDRSNLSSSAELSSEAGGLSGAPLKAKSLEFLQTLRKELSDDKCIISVGGVENAADYNARIEAGANLVQAYTAFIYQGPYWPRAILKTVLKQSNP